MPGRDATRRAANVATSPSITEPRSETTVRERSARKPEKGTAISSPVPSTMAAIDGDRFESLLVGLTYRSTTPFRPDLSPGCSLILTTWGEERSCDCPSSFVARSGPGPDRRSRSRSPLRRRRTEGVGGFVQQRDVRRGGRETDRAGRRLAQRVVQGAGHGL